MFRKIKNPTQKLLDKLLAEEKTHFTTCPDCGVPVNTPHADGCDVARCLATGQQRLSCDCGECGEDVWTGMWPGIQECYDQKLVCFDTCTNSTGFDLNEQARLAMKKLKRKK